MGLFSTTKSSFPWTTLESTEQLHDLISASDNKPLVIFKHSTRCSISRMALHDFEGEFTPNENVELAFLDLIANRDISNEIAASLGVTHQSPQVLLVINGKVVHHSSHERIDAEIISNSIKPH